MTNVDCPSTNHDLFGNQNFFYVKNAINNFPQSDEFAGKRFCDNFKTVLTCIDDIIITYLISKLKLNTSIRLILKETK